MRLMEKLLFVFTGRIPNGNSRSVAYKDQVKETLDTARHFRKEADKAKKRAAHGDVVEALKALNASIERH